jgi:hypothetical protein
MPDPRLDKLGNVLVNYSVGLKPRQRLFVLTTPPGRSTATPCWLAAIPR